MKNTIKICTLIIGLIMAGGLSSAAFAAQVSCSALCGDCYDTGGAGLHCENIHSISGIGETLEIAYSNMTAKCPGHVKNNPDVRNYFYITPGVHQQQIGSNYLDSHPEAVCN